MGKEGGQTFNITHRGKEILKFPTTREGLKKLIIGESSLDSWKRTIATGIISLTAGVSQKQELVGVGIVYMLGVITHEIVAIKRRVREFKQSEEYRKMEIKRQGSKLSENLFPFMDFVSSNDLNIPERLREEGIDELGLKRTVTQNHMIKKVSLTLKGEAVEEVIPTLNFWQIGGRKGQLIYIEDGLSSNPEIYNLKLANYALQEIALSTPKSIK